MTNAFSGLVAQALAQSEVIGRNIAKAPKTVASEKAKAKVASTKPAQKAVVAQVAEKRIPFGIHNGSRPSAGKALFALTHAWLSLSGMAEGKAYPKAEAVQVAGATAINYHTGNGNFASEGGFLKLTDKGQRFFGGQRLAERTVPHELVAAWVEVLKTGKPSNKVGPANADCFFRTK